MEADGSWQHEKITLLPLNREYGFLQVAAWFAITK